MQDELRAKGQASESKFDQALDRLCASALDAISLADRKDELGGSIIPFQWAKFSARDKPVTGMEVVLCAPEKADAEITNAGQLVGKMAAVYRGASTFQVKAERLIAAGAHGIIIINTEDKLFKAPAADAGFSASIPVVVIKAKDANALLASGNSSSLEAIPDVDCREAMVRAGAMELLLRCAEDAVAGGQGKRASKAVSCTRAIAADPAPCLALDKPNDFESFEFEFSYNNAESTSRMPEHIPALLRLARGGEQLEGMQAETVRFETLRMIAGRRSGNKSIAEIVWRAGGEQIVPHMRIQ